MTLAVTPPVKSPREILVVKPSSLGDVVHTLPAIALIKARWPQARIRWLINPEWAPLLEGNPDIAAAVIFPRSEFRGALGALRIAPWARGLRERVRADLVLDFQGLLRSALISRLVRTAGGKIVGLNDAREGARHLYDQRVDVAGCTHAVDRYLALVSALGIDIAGPHSWKLPTGACPAGFDATAPFILLHPFSRGAGKSLTSEQVHELCAALAPARVVLVGGSDESPPALANVTDLLNRTTLGELAWLIRRAAYTISVDSGPMHIAAALTTRLLALHTWSDPAKVGPYRPEAWVWKDGALFQQKAPALRNSAAGMQALAHFVQAQL